ncbi:hypothetical protein AB0H49_04195 [Nocardia sp. NPDC050713]|uniref:hypothetical protein n=1 Tax=Nocardia sp. NPDC050713 TaxID=3154511 RepID=UPI00340B75DE
MTARFTTIDEPTLQDKVTYQLCEYANLVNTISKEDNDLEGTLYQKVQQYLDANEEIIGGWEIVWGPGVALSDTDLYAVNALYMVRSTEDRSRYVIAMAGSSDALVFDWLVEDSFILQTPWFANSAAWHTIGTAIGVKTLLGIRPSGLRPGAGHTLPEFLSALDDKAIDLTVTGHSLGGALSPTLALFLRDTMAMGQFRESQDQRALDRRTEFLQSGIRQLHHPTPATSAALRQRPRRRPAHVEPARHRWRQGSLLQEQPACS